MHGPWFEEYTTDSLQRKVLCTWNPGQGLRMAALPGRHPVFAARESGIFAPLSMV